MGTLFYGTTFDPIEVPDPVLAHLRALISHKLRRGECFTISWKHPEGAPAGQTTIWLQPAIPLRFVLDTPDRSPLDRATLTRLVDGANTVGGLIIDLSAPLEDSLQSESEWLLQEA